MEPNDSVEFTPEFPTIIDRRKRAMLEALKKSLGIVSQAASKVGISRDTHYDWMAADPSYSHAVRMIADAAIDFVESKMFQLINGITVLIPGKDGEMQEVYTKEPNAGLIKYYLSTKAKHRGYVERLQLTTPEVEEFDLTFKIASEQAKKQDH